MTTEPNPMARSDLTPSTMEPARSRVARALPRMAFVAAIVLIPLDLVRLWRDSGPIPDRATIRNLIATKQVEGAESALVATLRRSPHDGEARMDLARLLGGQGRTLESAAELHRVPDWFERKPEAAFLEGESWKLVDRMRDAEAAWRRARRGDRLHPPPPSIESAANSELLELMAIEERWDEAHAIIREAFETAGRADHPAILTMWVRTELERIEPAASLVTLRRYLAADPDDLRARLAVARAAQATGDVATARAEARAGLDRAPTDPAAWRTWLGILHAQGDLPTLLDAIRTLPETARDDPEVWSYRALAAETSGDLAAATVAYREALTRRPGEAEYHYKLAMAEERLGHRDEAAAHRRRNRELRDARARLVAAYHDYLESDRSPTPDGARHAQAITTLADVCDDLGWADLADSWRTLAD